MCKQITCPWCGFSGTIEDFDTNDLGFWCPDCDGYFYKNPAQDHRRLLLFLEDKQDKTKATIQPSGLRKRISPLRYPGGKSKVIDQIYAELNQQKLHTFVELFAGGGSLGLSLLDAGKIERLVLNDYDPFVYNFWHTVIHHSDELIPFIQNNPTPDMIAFQNAKLTIKSSIEKIDRLPLSRRIYLAWCFLLSNRLSYGGIVFAGPIGGKEGKHLLQRWNPEMIIQRIQRIAELAPKIMVLNYDAATLMENSVGWYPENTTIFIDPPYVQAGPKLYKEGYVGQHEELAAMLNEFHMCYPGPDIIITYDDCELIRNLYPEAEIKMLHHSWSIAKP